MDKKIYPIRRGGGARIMQVKQVLHIVAGYKNSKTFLKYSYAAQPFKIANISENKSQNLLRLMMTSSSPGILDNDHYLVDIDVEENAQMHITTQGFQRLFTMKENASQVMNVHVANDASFYFLPHPIVPHKDSDFTSVNNIFLKKVHHIVWSEIITCGRKLSGEEFQFTKFHSVTNIFLNERLIIKENVLLEPIKNNIRAIGQFEGFTHQSALLFINSDVDMVFIAEACKQILIKTNEVEFGISKLPVNGLIIRMLGYKGEELFNFNNKIASFIQDFVAKERQLKGVDLRGTVQNMSFEKEQTDK
jgi:urease accessory protein